LEPQPKFSLKQKFKIYWPFALSEIQGALSYRGRFYFFILARLFSIFITYFLWKAIFASSGQEMINGFTFDNMVWYIFISYLSADLIGSVSTSYIGYEVVDGSIAINLIRPINYRMRLFFTSLGSILYKLIMPTLPIWISFTIIRYLSAQELPPALMTIIQFFVSLTLSFLIMFLFDFCFAMLSFYTTYVWGLNVVKSSVLRFLTGELIPITFFPAVVQKALRFLPFSSMNYTPVMVYLGKIKGTAYWQSIATQVVWVVILYFLGSFLWNRAIKRLTILGG